MKIFAPGEVRTATAKITVSPSGLNCNAELFLGPNETTKSATSGLVPFKSTGSIQPVKLGVTMPKGGVLYHVYLDIYADSVRILAAQGIDDIVIPSSLVEPIVWE